ncbi:MAG: arginase, partial [Planctomycetes bacterium]|nr:arginase [Planctomycetota bacterium]
MSIFDLTLRPSPDVFFKKGDPNDIRLGEIAEYESEESYEKSDIVILGSPQDEGVKRNKGRSGARAAPFEVRKSFYKLVCAPE